MTISINITRRDRKRKLNSGASVTQTRYVVNFREPKTGRRVQLFFERHKDAQAKRNQIIADVANGGYADDRQTITVAAAIRRWLDNRQGEVKAQTLKGYRQTAVLIVGPLLIGKREQRDEYTRTGNKPAGTRLIPMLGDFQLKELTTADIRGWHRTVATGVGAHSANRAKMFLGAALALAAEDYNLKTPALPRIGRGQPKPKKAILTTEQVARIIDYARANPERGMAVAMLFLSGLRPSEMLGLLFQDLDFGHDVIRVSRSQNRDGTLSDCTKTAAGMRDIPMGATLRKLLLAWREICPRLNGELCRVFPGPGQMQPWPLPRIGGGGPLLYNNFRNRHWVAVLRRLGLPAATPHSARHFFISLLQAQGAELGVVAQLAGHSNPSVTAGVYTHALRGGEAAIAALERAFVPGGLKAPDQPNLPATEAA